MKPAAWPNAVPLYDVPARATAGLVMLTRPRAATNVWRTVRRDAAAHPSPNSGVAEAAFAAALGVIGFIYVVFMRTKFGVYARATMQNASIIHGVVAMLFIAAMLGHIYIGTIGMEGAFEAMGESRYRGSFGIVPASTRRSSS